MLWQRYGVGYGDYVSRVTAGQADVMLRALSDGDEREPGTSAFSEPPQLDL